MLVCVVTLFWAPGAAAAPSVTFKCTPAPEDCTGWYRSDVSIEWTVLPSDATKTGCVDQTLATDTSGATVLCRADDGVTAVTVEHTLRVDRTPPVVTGGTPDRGDDFNGWYIDPVVVKFAGEDATSGLSTCTETTYEGPDSATANVQGICMDRAGNVSAPFGYGLKYDDTAPAVTAARPEREPNANGWFNQAVRFAIDGSDATSGIADCAPVTYSGPDSAAGTVIGSCRDQAGHAGHRRFTIKYDSTAPPVPVGQAARPADSGEWYNRRLRVAFSGTDQLAGIASCTATDYDGPDSADAEVSGTCADRAGNISPEAVFRFSYDGTKPAVTSARAGRPPNANGWYNSAIPVTFSGDDQTAGIQGCETLTYDGPDSDAASVAGTCKDHAGNVSNEFTFPLKYDATAPTDVTAEPNHPVNPNGWFNRPVAFTIRGADATSGIAACPGTFYGGPDDASASITAVCRDRAGNFASEEFRIKYDATPPELTGVQREREPDREGWYVRPVTFDVTGHDVMSKLGSCPRVTYSGPDSGSATVVVSCHDLAGNTSSSGIPLKYDANPPPLARVVAAGGDRSVSLSWQTSRDAVNVAIVRTPGLRGQLTTGVYNGTGTGFVDNSVVNGVRYQYDFTVSDAAGNVGRHTVVGLPTAPQPDRSPPPPARSAPVTSPATPPRPRSLLPLPGTVVRGAEPLLFQWPRARRATYYNVQLFRGGRKILSTWPTPPRFKLKTRWTFRGERRRLAPGRYRWMVWPGYGRRSKADFGKRIVNSTFTVKRAGAAGT